MNSVQVLDCTLRDGGYCNQWNFGNGNIIKIVDRLVRANVDIIECGFLTNKVKYADDVTKFTSLAEVRKIIPEEREGKLFVLMLNYGEFDLDELEPYDGTTIDGIRVAFHKKDVCNALEWCNRIKEKGYKVFVQAMVSLSYSDEEFLNLIDKTNSLDPYAFYIVDSFGMMKSKDLIRLFYMVEHNLNDTISIGFHSHNNMQLAYSNAQALVGIQTHRNLIIDSSVYGMGRGAGNLNTELFIEYLNENCGKEYKLAPILSIIDEILAQAYQEKYWGYSLPNYISASHNAHPNYAGYLDDKKTLTVEGMNELFDMMDGDKKYIFDKDYIEQLYTDYMSSKSIADSKYDKGKNSFKNKTILLIAPGRSSKEQKTRILDRINKKDCIVVSINHRYAFGAVDYVFVSNHRRYKEIDNFEKNRFIVTSNINSEDESICADYSELINSEECVKDNAGLLAIKYFIDCNSKNIVLAGFDGYSHDVQDNYSDDKMVLGTRNDVLDSMNRGMTKVLNEYSKSINISFLTEPKYVYLGEL